jgi:hypothetical protein
VLKWSGPVLEGFGLLLDVGCVSVGVKLGNRRGLADNDVIAEHLDTWGDNAIFIKLVVSAELPPRRLGRLWDREFLIDPFRVFIGPEKCRPEEPSVNCTLVEHDGVFLIVP